MADARFTQRECCVRDWERETPEALRFQPFIVCLCCGNKRCPKATDHRLACTQSNEVGQPGSSWANVPLPLKDACPTCGSTDPALVHGYRHLIDEDCDDPWHPTKDEPYLTKVTRKGNAGSPDEGGRP
jgi:hypothetical protein